VSPVGPVVLAEVVRSGFVEGHHAGIAIGLDESGAAAVSAGDPDRPVFPRSSNKPMQAVGMLRCGLDLDGELLALACSSHSGEEFHLDGVRRILAAAGLETSALQTPADLPLDKVEADAWLRAGRDSEPLVMNCSGKHAAMLATCMVNGWPTQTYLSPDHPLQERLRAALEDLAGEKVAATGVDGCGAPVWAISLTGLARAFRVMATAPPGTPEYRVARAIASYPEWLGGTRRDVTALLRALPGSVAKDGAEGVYAVAFSDGRAAAVKIDDGAERARIPVLAAVLARLGIALPDAVSKVAIIGGGRPVGEVRATL
jgi:L-asparaginase II